MAERRRSRAGGRPSRRGAVWNDWLQAAVDAALSAGVEIMNVYARPGAVHWKEDRSPLTEADTNADRVIQERLRPTGLSVLTEESAAAPFAVRKTWTRFWLVDPMDGTKEFIRRNGEFTVNIALVEEGRPIMGVVSAPALGLLYVGFNADDCREAWKIERCGGGTWDEMASRAIPMPRGPARAASTALRVVASRSHGNEETEAFLRRLERVAGTVERVPVGSSLKLCRVAEGKADVYPRLAPTMEWDTAAAQAVVEAAGGRVVEYLPEVPAEAYLERGAEVGGRRSEVGVPCRMPQAPGPTPALRPLRYNKPDLLNPFFVVTR